MVHPPHVHTHLSRIVGHLLALSAALIWSFNFIAIKTVRTDLGPHTLAVLRFDVSLVIILVIMLIRRPNLRAIRPTSWALIAGVAVLAGPGFHLLLNIGVTGTDSGLVAILVATQSLHMIWAGPLFLRERVRARQIVGLVIGFAGLAFTLAMTADLGYQHLGYPLLILVGAMLAGSNIILPRILTAHVHPIDLACLVLAIGAIISQPLLLAGGVAEMRDMSTTNWLLTLYLGSIGLIFVLAVWYEALRRLTAVTTGVYLFVMMAASVGWGALFFEEALNWTYAVAAVAVVVGIYLNATAGAIHRKPVMLD